MSAKYPVTSERIVMYDSVNAAALPAHTTKAAGYVNGDELSYAAIRQRFPGAQVHGIDVTGTDWNQASILDYEFGDGTWDQPDKVRLWVSQRNRFRPETACVYAEASVLAEVEGYLAGYWHVLWVANWGANGTSGQSLTGTRTPAGNLIVATQLQNRAAAGYDVSDSLKSW